MACPFCGGPVEDENCRTCGSLEGFTAAEVRSVTVKPSKMVAMSTDWTDQYAPVQSGTVHSGGGGGGGGEVTAASDGDCEDDEPDLSDTDIFEFSCVDNALRVVHVRVHDHTYAISQEMEPDDLAPLFTDVWTGSQVWRCSVVSSIFLSQLFACQPTGAEEDDDGLSAEEGPAVPTAIAAGPTMSSAARTTTAEVAADGAAVATVVDKDQVSGLRCIELGSGCGLLAVHAARIGMVQVVATDQPAMVRLAQHNIEVRFLFVYYHLIASGSLSLCYCCCCCCCRCCCCRRRCCCCCRRRRCCCCCGRCRRRCWRCRWCVLSCCV
jgi:hypothetical protein